MPVLNQENFDALHVRVEALEAVMLNNGGLNVVLAPVIGGFYMGGFYMGGFVSTAFAVSASSEPPPSPVDCVLSEWAMESAEPWGACQSNGTQTRTETWMRAIETDPLNGGAACGPLSETRTGLQVCSPPPDSAWPPTEPTVPMPGWKTGDGYPEPRVHRQSQWWESLEGDIDKANHFHVEAATPRVVNAGIIRFDLSTRFFHGQDYTFTGIRKVVRRTNQPSQVWMPTYKSGRAPGIREVAITEHDVEFWTPVFMDLRGTTHGTYTFEFDAAAVRPDGQNVQSRLIFKMTLGGGAGAASMTAEGWVSNNESSEQFGYLSVKTRGYREFASDPATSTVTLEPRATVGRTVRLVVCKNPDMHLHPPNYGMVLFDQTFVQPLNPPQYFIPQPVMVVGDRLFVRISDSGIPTLGAAAQVSVIKLANG